MVIADNQTVARCVGTQVLKCSITGCQSTIKKDTFYIRMRNNLNSESVPHLSLKDE